MTIATKTPRTRRSPKALAETAKAAIEQLTPTTPDEAPAKKSRRPDLAIRKAGRAALEANIDAAYREIASRDAQGEDVSTLTVSPDTAAIEAPAPTGYTGPMLALRERAKQGQYKKAVNGQPSCGDEVATILGSLKPEQVIRACVIALNLPGNPYTHLNIGQQSMNLRNKLRGAMKRGEFGMGVVTEAAEEAAETQAA